LVGKRRRAAQDLAAGGAELVREAAVLRGAFLGNVHAREHLESADQAALGNRGKPAVLLQRSVDPEPNPNVLLGRVDMDIGGLADDRRVEQFLAQGHGVFRIGVGRLARVDRPAARRGRPGQSA